MRIALIVSQFNKRISDRLLKGARKAFEKRGLRGKNIEVFFVPGAFEIPAFAKKLIDRKTYDGLMVLGCIVKGETDHYRAVCDGVTFGIQKISIENRIPIMFGVLMCEDESQALKRSQENPKHNKGYECAEGLLSML